MRQLGLLYMIAKLGPTHVLHHHAIYILHHRIPTSWFSQVREITLLYSLPDPLVTLTSPPTKAVWKSAVKSAVCRHWHDKLVAEAATLPSLCHLRTPFLPLGRGSHPVWHTCGPSSSAVRAATIQARMLSGRYRTDWLRRHWGPGETGACRLPSCTSPRGDLVHLLSGACPALAPTLARTLCHAINLLSPFSIIIHTIQDALLKEPEEVTSFLLDPSTFSSVIPLTQQHGKEILVLLFRFSRAWVWAAHRQSFRLLGLHQYLL